MGGGGVPRTYFAIKRLGKGEGCGSLTHPSRPGEEIGVGDPPGHERPVKEPNGSRLPNQITKWHNRTDFEDG